MPVNPAEIAKLAIGIAKDVVSTLADRFLGGSDSDSSYSPPPPPPPRRDPPKADPIAEATRRTEKVADEVKEAAEKVEKVAKKRAPKKSTAKKSTAKKSAAKPTKSTAKAKGKKASTAKAAPAKKGKATGAKKGGRKKAAGPKKLTSAEIRELPAAERWPAYVSGLSESSQQFLKLLEEKGRLTIEEAVATLDVTGPKAIGGMTGAMSRWAPKAGVETLPFEAKEDENGDRYWVWNG